MRQLEDKTHSFKQGFLTSEFAFIDRCEGAAHAFTCGQIEECTTCLFSEDLW